LLHAVSNDCKTLHKQYTLHRTSDNNLNHSPSSLTLTGHCRWPARSTNRSNR